MFTLVPIELASDATDTPDNLDSYSTFLVGVVIKRHSKTSNFEINSKIIKVTTDRKVYSFRNMQFFFESKKSSISNHGYYILYIRELSCIRGGLPLDLFINGFKTYPKYRLENNSENPMSLNEVRETLISIDTDQDCGGQNILDSTDCFSCKQNSNKYYKDFKCHECGNQGSG